MIAKQQMERSSKNISHFGAILLRNKNVLTLFTFYFLKFNQKVVINCYNKSKSNFTNLNNFRLSLICDAQTTILVAFLVFLYSYVISL